MPNADGTMTAYEYRKLNHRCVRCGERDAYTENGRAYCAVCAEKHNERAKEFFARHKDSIMAQRKERRSRLKEEGLCTRCGRKPETGHTLCARCSAQVRKHDRKWRERAGAVSDEKMRALGLCTRCRKEKALENYALCRGCLDWWLSVRSSVKKNEFFTFDGTCKAKK